jgi:hypothetical protein
MELTGEWTIPIGGKWPLSFTWKNDDLPTGVTIASATKTVSPASGLTVGDPTLNSASDGVNFWAEAVTAGSYTILIVATRSDGGKNVALGFVSVPAVTKATSLASNALISVADLSRLMGEEVSTGLAEMVINSVSSEFDRYTGRTLKQTAYTNLYIDGNGDKILQLPNWPAASVTGVYEDDTLLTEGLDYDYTVYTSDDEAYLYKLSSTWPGLLSESAVWAKGPKTIKITSVSLGYATIPGDLVLAATKQAAVEYLRAKQKTWNDTSRSVETGSVSLVEPGLLPDVEAVLKRYRRFRV